jgi:hypothetical protein
LHIGRTVVAGVLGRRVAVSLQHDLLGVKKYRDLLGLVKDEDVRLEESARSMIMAEEDHLARSRLSTINARGL